LNVLSDNEPQVLVASGIWNIMEKHLIVAILASNYRSLDFDTVNIFN
jgi:hypothetical protein